jgi:Flp pilus assembly pilin Flp
MKSRHNGEIGANMVEYALLVALLAIIGIASLKIFGESINDIYCKVFEWRYDPILKECVPNLPSE